MNIIALLLLQAGAAEADTLAELLHEESSMSFYEVLSQGGILMIPLFVLSVLAIYVIAERWRTLDNSKMDINHTLNSY
jgi:biopolymer transport protein ExbB